jgi:hypothetical protein
LSDAFPFFPTLYFVFITIECVSFLVVYPLPPKGGCKTAIVLRISSMIFLKPPFRGVGGYKRGIRNLLKYD